MENANQPIYPDPMRGAEQSFTNQSPHELPTGLTKREYFAGLAMQGLLSNKYFQTYKDGELIYDRMSKTSVDASEALLKALESKSE